MAVGEKPYVLWALIESERPVDLQILGYERSMPNTFYFNRIYANRPDGLFQGKEWLRFPLPIVPDKLEMLCLDRRTGAGEGIKILKLGSKPLVQLPLLERSPEMVEFVQFALWVAKYGGILGFGSNYSKNGLWHMEVVREIRQKDFYLPGVSHKIETPASTSHVNGDIFLVRDDIESISVCNRFVIMCHEVFHFRKNTKDEFACDMFAIQTAYRLGFGKSEIDATLPRLFGNCVGEKCREIEQRAAMVNQWLQMQPDLN